jgi:hypothetical protein
MQATDETLHQQTSADIMTYGRHARIIASHVVFLSLGGVTVSVLSLIDVIHDSPGLEVGEGWIGKVYIYLSILVYIYSMVCHIGFRTELHFIASKVRQDKTTVPGTIKYQVPPGSNIDHVTGMVVKSRV